MPSELQIREHSRIMVFAPHPDDESLGSGGLLQCASAAGAAVRVVFATDGDNNPWPQRVLEKRWRIGSEDRARWGKKRREEALRALARLGCNSGSSLFLGYPDQGITQLLVCGDTELLERIISEMGIFRPDLLIVPSMLDTHPDHSAVGALIRLACLVSGHCASPRVLYYLIHSRDRKDTGAAEEIVLPLSREGIERKRQAISCHASQMKLAQRRLLKLAGPHEVFFVAEAAGELSPLHPVRRVRQDGESLKFELVNRNYPGAFGPRALFLVGLLQNGGRIARSLQLPGRPGPVPLWDTTSKKQVATCHYKGNSSKGELILPTFALGAVRSLFVKVKRRFGFFDEAGWREVQLPEEA